MKDLFSNIKAVTTQVAALKPGSGVTTKGLAVDTAGFESATVVLEVGNSPEVLAAGLYIQPILLESDDTADANFTAVAVEDMIGGSQGAAGEIALINAPTEDTLVFLTGYRGNKRFLRVDLVLVGNHATGTPCAASIVLASARTNPGGTTAAGAALT